MEVNGVSSCLQTLNNCRSLFLRAYRHCHVPNLRSSSVYCSFDKHLTYDCLLPTAYCRLLFNYPQKQTERNHYDAAHYCSSPAPPLIVAFPDCSVHVVSNALGHRHPDGEVSLTVSDGPPARRRSPPAHPVET